MPRTVDIGRLLKYCGGPFLLSILLFSGCGVSKHIARETRRVGGHFSLQVAVSDKANKNQPIAVDLVLVKDNEVMKLLQQIPAAAWFDKRDQFLRDHGKKVEITSWEWVPGEVIPEVEMKISPAVTGAIIFAHYSTPGDHRAVITSFGPSELNLDEEDFSYQPRKG
jgi:type VI secretion system protein